MSCVRKVLLFLLFALALFPTGAAPAAEESVRLRRWAIVADEPLQASGFADLLTTKLTTQQEIQLVERDLLAEVIQEQELSAFLGSEQVGRRLKLGSVLQADALVFLTMIQREESRFVRLVISDTSYGARLRTEIFAYEREKLEALADRCVEAARETRSRFAGGIRRLIGAPSFLSQNLTHEYDSWQAGFAGLLQQALMQAPGAAVVEIDEARSIQRELTLGGGQRVDRVWPLFVEGEYQSASTAAAPTVQLTVRLVDGEGAKRTVHRSGLTLDKAVDWITGELPGLLLETIEAGDAKPLDKAQQFARLAARADVFSQAGAWREATSLRETALLLQPDDVDQRLGLIGDYRHWTWEAWPASFPYKRKATNSPSDFPPFDPLGALRYLSRRIEALIVGRAVNPREADMLMSICWEEAMRIWIPNAEDPAQVRRENERVFWRMASEFPHLDPAIRGGGLHPAVARGFPRVRLRPADVRPWTPQWQEEVWRRHACEFLLIHARRRHGVSMDRNGRAASHPTGYDDSRTLEDLARFFDEVPPAKQPLSFMIGYAAGSGYPGLIYLIQRGRYSAEDLAAFYGQLKDAGGPLHEAYARMGQLALRAYLDHGPPLDAAALAETKDLIALFEERGKWTADSRAMQPLAALRSRIEGALQGAPPKGHSLPPNIIPEPVEHARIRFQPLKSPLIARWMHVLDCGGFDVMWSEFAVYAMREKGRVERLFEESDIYDRILDLSFDGRYVWIAMQRSGVHVVSLEGRRVASLQAGEELPPYDRLIETHALGVGRCLAVGCFGRESRAWIAAIELPDAPDRSAPDAGAEPRVRVIQQATKAAGGEDDPADEVFDVAWLLEYAPADRPEEKVLLVGRRARPGPEQKLGRRPLAVDLTTLEVSVWPARLPAAKHGASQVVDAQGKVLHVGHVGHGLIEVLAPRGGPATRRSWERFPLLEIPGNDLRELILLRTDLLKVQGRWYNPGPWWRKIDLTTPEVEPLHGAPLPLRHRYQCFGVSAHYGPVAWNVHDRVHQVLIDPPADRAPDPAQEYFFVPEDRRAGHRAAVESIRRAGGFVDSVYGMRVDDLQLPGALSPRARDSRSPNEWQRQWRTIVHLPATWKGGRLAELHDLYGLYALYSVRAPVTNDDLAELRGLNDLELLWLVETEATNAGLSHLRGLPGLVDLRLESTAGAIGFSDQGLEHLRPLSKLARLSLYGPGFADAGLPRLKELDSLQFLTLYDTAHTPEALDALKRSFTDRSFHWRVE
ncbi:MAG: hypothetical protein KY475_03205 [Planctomycetes bacterium]|nr:hypothetical protein [Planctomycetota bacterium]